MKKLIIAMVLSVFLPVGFAGAAAYIKFDGVEGESTAVATATLNIGIVQTQSSTGKGGTENINIGVGELQESQTAPSRVNSVGAVPNAGIEPDEIDASVEAAGATASGTKKGNVEFEWKVEEGEKGTPGGSTGPDEIGAADGSEPAATNFGVLLGGDSDDEAAEESRTEVAEILKQGMAEASMPVESISLNFEKITTKVKKSGKLFGLFPVSVTATVEIDANEQVKVKFPWWTFLVSGKDGNSLGQTVFTTLSNVLKTKHDTIKNSIGNIR